MSEPENGFRRFNETSFCQEVYLAGQWCSMELLQDCKGMFKPDNEVFVEIFGDRSDEALEYLGLK